MQRIYFAKTLDGQTSERFTDIESAKQWLEAMEPRRVGFRTENHGTNWMQTECYIHVKRAS